jgi:hypothetical protein
MRDMYTQISVGHFINDATGDEFKTGDKITLTPDHSYGDGKRFFTIKKFLITDNGHVGYEPLERNNGKKFGFVYVHFFGEDHTRESHLSGIMQTTDDEFVFASHSPIANDRTKLYPLIDRWRSKQEEKRKERKEEKSKTKYYNLI